eukprot:gene18471-18747_t
MRDFDCAGTGCAEALMLVRRTPWLDWMTRRSLRERIGLCLALLVFVVAGILGGLVGRVSEIQARGRIGQSLAIDAQRLADRLTTEMAARTRELSLLASIDAIRDLPAFAAHSSLPGGAPPFVPALERTQYLLDGLKRSVSAYTWIAIANPAGRVLAATDPASNGTDIATRSSTGEGLRGAGTGPLRDQRVMDLVQPIREADGTVVGLIAAQLTWNWVRGIERSVVTQDADGVVRRESFLINSQDVVVFGPPGTTGLTVSVPAAARARAGFYGWSVDHWPTPTDDPDEAFLTGAAFVAGDGPAPGPGSQAMRWSVLVREAEAVAFAPATALRNVIWLAGLATAVAFAAEAIQSPYNLSGRVVQVGCSLGGACWPAHAGDGTESGLIGAGIDAVIAHADAELYAVKRSGKGRREKIRGVPAKIRNRIPQNRLQSQARYEKPTVTDGEFDMRSAIALGLFSVLAVSTAAQAAPNLAFGASVVSATSFYSAFGSTFAPSNIIDGVGGDVTSPASYWITPDLTLSGSITIDLGANYNISSFVIQDTHNATFFDRGTKDWKIGVGSTAVASQSASTATGTFTVAQWKGLTDVTITTPATGRYVTISALNGYANTPGDSAGLGTSSPTTASVGFNEIQVFGTAVAAVPEPISMTILGTGLVGLLAMRRRSRIASAGKASADHEFVVAFRPGDRAFDDAVD